MAKKDLVLNISRRSASKRSQLER